MKYDGVLRQIGEFGKFQKIRYFLVCLVVVAFAFQALASIFTLYTPKHRYVCPGLLTYCPIIRNL